MKFRTLMLGAAIIAGLATADAALYVTDINPDPYGNTPLYVLENGTCEATVTFNEPAKITSAMAFYPFSTYSFETKLTSGTGTYGTEWTIIFSEKYISTMLKDNNPNVRCVIDAVSENGSSINGEQIYMDHPISTDVQGEDFDVIVPATSKGSLTHFYVSYPEGYVDANDVNMVIDGKINNFFKEIEITGPANFKANAERFDKLDNQAVYFSPEITQSGTYTITFPFRAFNLAVPNKGTGDDLGDLEGDISYFSMKKTYTFTVTIEEAVFMPDAELMNPQGTYMSNLGSGFEFNFGTTDIQLVSPSDVENDNGFIYSTIPAKLYIENNGDRLGEYEVYPYLINILEGGNDPGIAWSVEDGDEMVTETILLADVGFLYEEFEWVLPVGTYTLSLPAGIVSNAAGDINPAQNVTVNIMKTTPEGAENFPPSYDVSDDSWPLISYNASELANVSVIWEDGTLSKIEGSLPVTVGPNEFFATTTPLEFGKEVTIPSSDESSKLCINLSDLEDGEWVVTIPEGYVMIGGAYINSDMAFTYLISSNLMVSGLEAESGLYKVYDLNGVNVMNTADKAQLNTLPCGLYVINGKKVIKR